MRICAYILLFLSALTNTNGHAQTPQFLPLQTHKVQWANAVIKNALRTKDTLQLAEGYYLYGKIYDNAGDLLTAKKFFLKSLQIQEKRGDSEELARLYSWFSVLACKQLYYEDARRYNQLLMGVAKRLNTERALLRAYGHIRDFYLMNWQAINPQFPAPNPDSAFYYLKIQEPLVRRTKDTMDLSAFLTRMGEYHLDRREAKAIDYFEEALQLSILSKNPFQEGNNLFYLGRAYCILGMPDRGIVYIKKCEQLQKTLPSNAQNSTKDKSFLVSAYHQYYLAKGNWQKAYQYQQEEATIEKQRILADRDGAVSRLSVSYETDKKETQIRSQQRELTLNQQAQQIQRNFLLALSVLLVGAIVAGVVFYQFWQKNKRLSRQNATLVREQNHRVKNNLQFISSLLSLQSNRLNDEAAKNAVEDTQNRIEMMVLLQRKLYDGQQLAEVTLLDFMSELVQMVLQSFNQEAVEVRYQIDADLNISADNAMRVGLIVNELATNAAKYAFADHEAPTFCIAAWVAQNIFYLRVADNGGGFDASKVLSKSFGMRLIQMQVTQLEGEYRFENDGGTKFEMKFEMK
jgi:two-component system, sensor histidine kinase PdtaS